MPALKPLITLTISRQGADLYEHTFRTETLVAGRAHDCDLVLDDHYVSSRHFRLDWDGQQLLFKDLNSSNGSWVNGQRVDEASLNQGDAIQVGETQALIARIARQGMDTDPAIDVRRQDRVETADESPSESGILFRPIIERMRLDLRHLWKEHDILARHADEMLVEPARDEIEAAHQQMHSLLRSMQTSLGLLGKDQSRLKALHSAIAVMNRVTDLRARLNAILDVAVEIMQADCGFLMLCDEKTQRINIALQRGMKIFDDAGEVDALMARSAMPSLSIAREVLRTRRSIATSDLRTSGQFDSSQSVMIQGVTGVLCAPLLFDDQLIGLIYVDFRSEGEGATRAFGPGDRELFEALASLAATAIQNAKFFRNIRLEEARRTSLQRYLAPELVDQVMRQDRSINLEGVRRHSAVLFGDIRGFTSFAESAAPDRLMKQLNQYFSAMTNAISAEGGSVDKFLGDGLMAFFGPLIELENFEVAAVRAARAMQRHMIEINDAWERQGWEGFQSGIAVSAGEVVAGNLGSSERLEYTVIGDTVNVASRLSAVAKPGQILVTRAVADRLPPGEFEIRALEPVSLKGRSGAVEIVEVAY